MVAPIIQLHKTNPLPLLSRTTSCTAPRNHSRSHSRHAGHQPFGEVLSRFGEVQLRLNIQESNMISVPGATASEPNCMAVHMHSNLTTPSSTVRRATLSRAHEEHLSDFDMGCSKSLGGSAPGILATNAVAAATTVFCWLGDSSPPSAPPKTVQHSDGSCALAVKLQQAFDGTPFSTPGIVFNLWYVSGRNKSGHNKKLYSLSMLPVEPGVGEREAPQCAQSRGNMHVRPSVWYIPDPSGGYHSCTKLKPGAS